MRGDIGQIMAQWQRVGWRRGRWVDEGVIGEKINGTLKISVNLLRKLQENEVHETKYWPKKICWGEGQALFGGRGSSP